MNPCEKSKEIEQMKIDIAVAKSEITSVKTDVREIKTDIKEINRNIKDNHIQQDKKINKIIMSVAGSIILLLLQLVFTLFEKG